MTHSKTSAGDTDNNEKEYCNEERKRDVVAAEVGRAALVELSSTGGLYLISRDEGEGICRCRIRFKVHPKSYGDIVCGALQMSAVIAAREEEEEEDEAAVQGKVVIEVAEADARFVRSARPPSPKGDGGGLLILTRSATLATHFISDVWHKRCSSNVKVNVKDGERTGRGRKRGKTTTLRCTCNPPPPPRYQGLLVRWIGVVALGRPQRPNER